MEDRRADDQRLQRIEAKVSKLYDVVCIGNGRDSLISQVAQNSQRCKLTLWAMAIVAVPFTAGIVGIILGKL